MPYVVSRLTPRKNKVNLIDFLNDMVTLDMIQPPSVFQTTGTRTAYYDTISPSKMQELNIPQQIEILQKFYERYKHFDVYNDSSYDYEYQLKVMRDVKSQFPDPEYSEERRIEEAKKILAQKNLKYFSFYSTFFIPKASSTEDHMKWRRIDAPCDELKEALRKFKEILSVMMDGCYYHTNAFAYIENRSSYDAAFKHAQNKSNWFLKTDFSNFFGNTTKEFLMRMLSDVFPFSEIVKTPEGRKALSDCLNLCMLNGGLPQGTPASPMLTNIMMIPIDQKLANGMKNHKIKSPNDETKEYGFVYTRYADDIIISNRMKFDSREVIGWIKSVLDMYDAPFEIKPEKTRFGSNAGENWILGLMVNQKYEVSVGHRRKNRLKCMLFNYINDRNKGIMWELEDIQVLQGEIAYQKSVQKQKTIDMIRKISTKHGDIEAAIKEDLRRAAV